MRSSFREADRLFRCGGEEFVVVVDRLTDELVLQGHVHMTINPGEVQNK